MTARVRINDGPTEVRLRHVPRRAKFREAIDKCRNTSRSSAMHFVCQADPCPKMSNHDARGFRSGHDESAKNACQKTHRRKDMAQNICTVRHHDGSLCVGLGVRFRFGFEVKRRVRVRV